jgi:heat-inducible transcriptional repressor
MDLKDYDLQRDVIIKGLKNFLQTDYFQKDFENLKRLLSLFEEKNKLIEMLDKSIKNPGIQIFIGSQNKEFENLSVITSSYSKNGLTLGSLGVIGPLRMNYNAIIPIVDCAAQIISTILDENFRRLS